MSLVSMSDLPDYLTDYPDAILGGRFYASNGLLEYLIYYSPINKVIFLVYPEGVVMQKGSQVIFSPSGLSLL